MSAVGARPSGGIFIRDEVDIVLRSCWRMARFHHLKGEREGILAGAAPGRFSGGNAAHVRGGGSAELRRSWEKSIQTAQSNADARFQNAEESMRPTGAVRDP